MQRGIARVATIVTQAPAQDFERKRRPGVVDKDAKYGDGQRGESSDEDEDDEEVSGSNGSAGDNQRDLLDAEGILERHRSAV